MPHGRGNNRGFRPGPPRGRGGRGRGRGGYRGGSRPGFVNAGEIYGGEGTLVFEGNFEDFTLDVVEPGTQRSFAKRGNHRGGYNLPRPPDFRGVTPRKFSRGIGFPKSSSGPRIPLSVLEKERPLLQPIRFVRGEHVQTLFEEVEEILHAPGEGETLAEDKLLSNDILEKIFHRELLVHDTCPSDSESTGEAGEEEKISGNCTLPDGVEEILIEPDKKIIQDRETLTENIDRSDTVIISEDKINVEGTEFAQGLTDTPEALIRKEEQTELFVVDTSPSPIVFGQGQSAVEESISKTIPLGEVPGEEEVIVYEAPNPRTNRVATPRPLVPTHPPTFDSISLSFTSKRDSQEVPPNVVQPRESLGLRSTPRSRKLAKKERAAVRRKQQRMSMFSLGLSHEDRAAMGEQSTPKRDRRKAQRRMASSDIDWGSVDEEDAGIEEIQSGIGDMDLDPDVADIAILSRLANRVQGFADDTVVTIDDLNDIQRMQEEDEATDSGSSRLVDEIEEFLDASERKQIGEVDAMDSSDSSIEDTPRTGFHARLNRLREQSKGKIPVHYSSSDGDDQTRGAFGNSWADRDEDFLNHIDELLDENDGILRGDRQMRKKMFKAIEQGDFDDDYDISFNSTKKNRHIPPQLRGQWESDRQKKAQRKRERELTRMEEAMNASPSRKGKLEKQKRKLFAHGGLSLDGNTLHTGDVDTLTMLESVMRRFLSSLELKNMVMPPKDKEFRRRAHLLADAFKVKSKSQGKDSHRFTTFIKTSRSGININERKVASIIGNMPGQSSTTRARFIRHRDGDVVGKAAPKLNDSNIGFKLLQQMGWNEGERIGVTGLADPLTAVIKTTKLGLGATR